MPFNSRKMLVNPVISELNCAQFGNSFFSDCFPNFRSRDFRENAF